MKRANTALKSVTAKACGKPNEDRQNIVTIFERPSFTPGTGIIGGIKDSKNEIAVAKAQNTPKKAALTAFALFKVMLLSTCNGIYIRGFAVAGNGNNRFCGNTGGGITDFA